MSQQTKCSVSREQFTSHAQHMRISIGEGGQLVASPKQFSTGSFGWYAGGKIVVDVDGVPCTVQVGVNLTLVGSKTVGV